MSKQNNTTPPRSARFMTFRELLDGKHESSDGTCRFCRGWNRPGRHYSIRHFVCVDCCEQRADEKLPSVAKAEAHARSYAKRIGDTPNARFVSHLAGVTIEYAQWLIDQETAERSARGPV